MAAYNMGPKNVRTVAKMDVGSPGGDYSNDVMARAKEAKKLSEKSTVKTNRN